MNSMLKTLNLKRRLILIIFGFWLQALHAEEVTYLGRKLEFVTPQSLCMVGNSPAEVAILQSHKSKSPNRVVELYADCSELDRVAAGEKNFSLTHYVIASIVKVRGQQTLAPISRQKFIADSIASDPVTDFQSILKKAQNVDPKVGESVYLGMLKADANAVYRGMIVTVSTTNSTHLALVVVNAMTIVNQVPISYNFYEAVTGGDQLEQMLHDSSMTMARLIRRNPSK